MGVVKNLMVRIGADVSGVVGGMKAAYSATRQASSQIKTATAGMKQSVKDSFSGWCQRHPGLFQRYPGDSGQCR